MSDDERIPRARRTEPAAAIAARLGESGAVVIEELVDHREIARLRADLAPLLESASLGNNAFDGYRTRRVFDPLARTRSLDGLVMHPLVQDVVTRSLQWPFQFGMTILSDIQPGEVAQRPHRDGSVYPLPSAFPDVMTNTIWALDDFTAVNGGTLIAPRSHREDRSDLVPVEMPAGSVLVYSGRLMHGAGANASSRARLGFIVEHVARWLRPADCHPVVIGPRLAATLSPQLQELVGFNQVSPYFGFIAGADPKEWLEQHAATGELPIEIRVQRRSDA